MSNANTNAPRPIVVPSVISFSLGRDSGATVDVVTKDIPANVLSEILATGIRLIMNNCQAGQETTALKRAQCEKKLDAWRAGDFHVKAGAGGDSIEAEVKRLILERVANASGKPVTAIGKEEFYKGRGYEVCQRIADAKDASLESVKEPLIEAAKLVIAARAEAKASTDTIDVASLF